MIAFRKTTIRDVLLVFGLTMVGCTQSSRTDLGDGYYLSRKAGIFPHSSQTLAIRYRGPTDDQAIWPWITIQGDPTVSGGMAIFSGGRKHREDSYDDSVGLFLSADGATPVEISEAIRRLAPDGQNLQFAGYDVEPTGVRIEFFRKTNHGWTTHMSWHDLHKWYQRTSELKGVETRSFEGFNYLVAQPYKPAS